MSNTSHKEIESLESACSQLLEMEKVRLVAVINKLGHKIAGRFKPGVTPMVDDEKVRMVYMQLMLDLRMRQELDEILGPVDYITSRRRDLAIITVPTEDYLVVISADRDVISQDVVSKAEELFDIIDLKEKKLD